MAITGATEEKLTHIAIPFNGKLITEVFSPLIYQAATNTHAAIYNFKQLINYHYTQFGIEGVPGQTRLSTAVPTISAVTYPNIIDAIQLVKKVPVKLIE